MAEIIFAEQGEILWLTLRERSHKGETVQLFSFGVSVRMKRLGQVALE